MTTLIGVQFFERLWVLVYLKENKIIDFFFTNHEKHIKMKRLSYVGESRHLERICRSLKFIVPLRGSRIVSTDKGTNLVRAVYKGRKPCSECGFTINLLCISNKDAFMC